MTTIGPIRLSRIAALAFAGSLAVCGPAEAGGLFDFLGSVFRGGASEPSFEDVPGLDMTVHPQSRRRSIRRSEASRGKPVNTAINPVDHPNWYLEDPTLRRGDIVVLPGKVLVYEGGRGPAAPDDFASLGRSRLISKADRLKVGSMAGVPAQPVARNAIAATPALPRTAAAQPN